MGSLKRVCWIAPQVSIPFTRPIPCSFFPSRRRSLLTPGVTEIGVQNLLQLDDYTPLCVLLAYAIPTATNPFSYDAHGWLVGWLVDGQEDQPVVGHFILLQAMNATAAPMEQRMHFHSKFQVVTTRIKPYPIV